MKSQDIKSPEGLYQYIEGCLNDLQTGISDQRETHTLLIGLVVECVERSKRKTESEMIDFCVFFTGKKEEKVRSMIKTWNKFQKKK